jgi:ferrous iron transport protein A
MVRVPSRLTRLTATPAGATAHIVEIRGGPALTRRLLGLGLRVGSQVRVVQQCGSGFLLSSEAVRVAIGSGVADQLWVAIVALAADVGADPVTV